MKIDKKTTVVGFADAMKQTLDIIAKRMNEQQSQINELERMVGHLKGDQYLTANRVNKLEKNPTKDK